MIGVAGALRRGLVILLAGAPLLWLASAPAAAPPGETRTHLPDHRLGPLVPGKTNETEVVARLGEGLKYPIEGGTGHCWAEERSMLCAAFEKGRLVSLSIQRGGSLPPAATRFLEGPDGKKPPPPKGKLLAQLRPNIFLASLATDTGLRIDSTEREVLAALGSPHTMTMTGGKPPFRFTYRSSRDNDTACPGRCLAIYTLSKEQLISIYLASE